MKKNIKLLSLFIVIITMIVVIPLNTYAKDYVINKYDMNIVVNENNTLDITENITAYFNVSRHGIYRTIPLKNEVSRLDGTTSKNRTQITNLYVDNEYKTSKEDGNYKIQIGSANRMVTGEQSYVIKYTYNLGKDPMKEYDELYFNIIGAEWDTTISDVTFSITMPKEFDSSKLGFSSGYVGSTNSEKVTYNVNNNIINGKYNGTLNEGEALTVRCELPEGYFVGAQLEINYFNYALMLIPVILLIISILIWHKYGKDDLVVETVEFYPPEGLNSLDVGFLYKGKAENKDVTSLLIYLANKGYIEIIDNSSGLATNNIKLGESSKDETNQKIIELQNKINNEKLADPNSSKIKYYENMLEIYKNIDKPINYEEYGIKSSINKFSKKDKFLIRRKKVIVEKIIMKNYF